MCCAAMCDRNFPIDESYLYIKATAYIYILHAAIYRCVKSKREPLANAIQKDGERERDGWVNFNIYCLYLSLGKKHLPGKQ